MVADPSAAPYGWTEAVARDAPIPKKRARADPRARNRVLIARSCRRTAPTSRRADTVVLFFGTRPAFISRKHLAISRTTSPSVAATAAQSRLRWPAFTRSLGSQAYKVPRRTRIAMAVRSACSLGSGTIVEAWDQRYADLVLATQHVWLRVDAE